ncbi:MAG: MarR family transcriptional regulator [Kiritimatiellae bacterium]|nr:MarR family transcriptional regulator [Kiritimatiellia bacterium]
MNKRERIALVNLHHGLGQCRKDAWEGFAHRLGVDYPALTFREVSTMQAVYRYELVHTSQLSLTELATRIQLKNAITSQTVSSLVGKGLMVRENDGDNRRKVMISLTEKGKKVTEEMAAFADTFLEKFIAPLTDDEKAALFKIAEKLNPTLPY